MNKVDIRYIKEIIEDLTEAIQASQEQSKKVLGVEKVDYAFSFGYLESIVKGCCHRLEDLIEDEN